MNELMPTSPMTATDLFDTLLKNKLNELYQENDPDYPWAFERLTHELAVIRREKYDEYFLDLADVVMLARQKQIRFWCLWEPLNRSLVAHLFGANPLNPIAWRLPSPVWPENGTNRPPHLTMMLHLSGVCEPTLRHYAVEHFGELKAHKLGLLPEVKTAEDRALIVSQPAHIALWPWSDIELQNDCLDLIRLRCHRHIKPEKIPLDSTQVFDLFYQGHTLGIFHAGVVPNEYFSTCFQKLRPRDLQELAVILGHFSPKGIPKMDAVCKKLSTFPKAPQHTKTEELRKLFDEMPSPAQSISTAWFAYQMAWLKIHYPMEFYSALSSKTKISTRMREMVAMERAARGLEVVTGPQVIVARTGLFSTEKLLDCDLKRRFTLGVLFRYWDVSFNYENRERLLRGAPPHWPIRPEALTALTADEDSRLPFSEDQFLSLLRSFTEQENEAVDQLLELCREVAQPFYRNQNEAFLKVERELINIYRLATLPGRQDGHYYPEVQSPKQELYALCTAVAEWWQKLLKSDPEAGPARTYLKSLDFTDELVEEFGLGYAPGGGDSTMEWAQKAEHSLETLEMARLITASDSGRFHDFFRGRLITPVLDESGQVIAFSGRLIDPEVNGRKFVNSPETPIYDKSRAMFGLNKTKPYIIEAESAIILEGLIDLMRCWQVGIRNVVAPQGPDFTEQHARILQRLAKEVVICFDADRAGESAAKRFGDICLKEGLKVLIVRLPEGEDPDSLLRKQPVDDFMKLLREAKDYNLEHER